MNRKMFHNFWIHSSYDLFELLPFVFWTETSSGDWSMNITFLVKNAGGKSPGSWGSSVEALDVTVAGARSNSAGAAGAAAIGGVGAPVSVAAYAFKAGTSFSSAAINATEALTAPVVPSSVMIAA
jgi:hypothetical protein